MRFVTPLRAFMMALLLLPVGLVVTASPASAHHPIVEGKAVCNTETGLFDLVWTIGNSEKDKVMTYSSRLGGGTVQPNPATTTLSEPGQQPGTYSLQVDASWPNGVKASATGSVVAEGDCAKPDQPVTSAGFEVAPPTCETDGSGTIPAQPDGVAVTPAPGSYGPGTYDVVFSATDGFVLDGNPSGTMTVLPATGFQADDPAKPCYRETEPETRVEPRADRRSDCTGVERRTWEVVFERDQGSEEWVRTGIRNDSGWVKVRSLTAQEQVARGCVEVEGKQERSPERSRTTSVPRPASGATGVPTSVDAGI